MRHSWTRIAFYCVLLRVGTPRVHAMSFARAAPLRLLWRASVEHWHVYAITYNAGLASEGLGRPWSKGPAPLP